MTKHQQKKQLPASAPGAAALPPEPSPEDIAELQPTPEILEVEDPEAKVSQTLAPIRARYRVANLFQGFREEDLLEGDVVEADEAEAEPFVGKDGVLTRIEDEA